jgi:RNA methyltransferase, TrmH family
VASYRAPDLTPLTSGNTRVKDARKLARRAFRAEHRTFLADGPKAVEGALGVPGCVIEVFATVAATEQYAALRHAAPAWTLVDDRALASLSEAVNPQGVVARCRFIDRPLDHVLDPAPRLLALCADVRDPGNAGTVIRTADAAGAGAVVLAGHSVDAYNAKTVRATVGSLFHLPLAIEPDPAEAVRRVQAAGLTAWGLPDELAALADHRVSIPIHGAAESLNLSTAAAICLYASARAQRRTGPAGG